MKYIIRKVTLTADQLGKLHKGILTRSRPTISLAKQQVLELSDLENSGLHQLPLTALQVNALEKSKQLEEGCKLTFHDLQLKEIAHDLFNEEMTVNLIAMKRK